MRSTTPSPRDISPELVLVDPELRAVEMARLAEEMLDLRGDAPNPALRSAAASSAPPASGTKPTERVDIAGRSSPRGRRLLLSVAAASLTVNAVVALGLLRPARSAPVVFDTSAVRTPPATTPTSAEESTPARPAGPPRSPQRRMVVVKSPTKLVVARSKDTASANARRPRKAVLARTAHIRPGVATHTAGIARTTLSWRTVKGASYYNVVIWRGHRRVLDLWPSSSRVVLPMTWGRGRARKSLSPGRYLWFAYPGIGSIASGRYGGHVQSGTLIVTDMKVSK